MVSVNQYHLQNMPIFAIIENVINQQVNVVLETTTESSYEHDECNRYVDQVLLELGGI